MSIKTQKILRFIPIVNLSTIAFWMLLQYRSGFSFSSFLKHLVAIFVSVLICMIPRMIASTNVDSPIVYDVIFYVSLYVQTLCIACVAIHAQEMIEKSSSSDKGSQQNN